MSLQLKICGMKHNTEAVARLSPDYLGFIFYEKSPRNFGGIIPEISDAIKRVGVFVNATADDIRDKVGRYQLEVIQLHGDESPEFCRQFHDQWEVWKVFSVTADFNFDTLLPYESVVDMFLFDTHTPSRGGSGQKFNWDVFASYPSDKPYILSGGIGPQDAQAIHDLAQKSPQLVAVDVNSRFEIEPGRKDIEQLHIFTEALQKRSSKPKEEL